MTVADALSRLCLALPLRRPSVLVVGTAAELAELHPALDRVLAAHPGYRLVLAVPPDEVAGMRRRYPHELVLAQPHAPLAGLWRRCLGIARTLDAGGQPAEAAFADLPDVPRPSAGSPVGARLVAWLAGGPVGSMAELKARLGAPRSIVCLGNGPSSEDARLAAYAEGAALLRVNWVWRQREHLAAPDVVFTVDPDLPDRDRAPVLLFPTAAIGRPILLRHALRGCPPRAGYGFLDQLTPPVADLSGRHIPTNGALMVAVAAALAPQRLVIAGIDLYRHPDGRYPGDADAVDGYTREHRQDLDLAVIRAALDTFAGEAIILSDNLRAALGRD